MWKRSEYFTNYERSRRRVKIYTVLLAVIVITYPLFFVIADGNTYLLRFFMDPCSGDEEMTALDQTNVERSGEGVYKKINQNIWNLLDCNDSVIVYLQG